MDSLIKNVNRNILKQTRPGHNALVRTEVSLGSETRCDRISASEGGGAKWNILKKQAKTTRNWRAARLRSWPRNGTAEKYNSVRVSDSYRVFRLVTQPLEQKVRRQRQTVVNGRTSCWYRQLVSEFRYDPLLTDGRVEVIAARTWRRTNMISADCHRQSSTWSTVLRSLPDIQENATQRQHRVDSIVTALRGRGDSMLYRFVNRRNGRRANCITFKFRGLLFSYWPSWGFQCFFFRHRGCKH